MAIYVVPDTHIYSSSDPAYQDLLRFLENLKNPLSEATSCIFLGDIFDFCVGYFEEFYDIYEDFWIKLEELSLLGIECVYIEGNHDFCLAPLFKKKRNKILCVRWSHTLVFEEKTIFFAHGDLWDGGRLHRLYRKIVSHFLFWSLLGPFLSFSFVKKLGTFLSEKSRRYGEKENWKELGVVIQEKYRKNARSFFQKNSDVDILVWGHSHYQEDWTYKGKYRYLNPGFLKQHKQILKISKNSIEFIEIFNS